MRSLRFVLPLASLVLSSACLLTPAHEQEVCGADESLVFSGYALGAGGTVTIEAATSPSGPFTSIGTTATSNSPTNVWTGETFYAFSTQSPVEAWDTDPSGLSLYLRARAGSVRLLTFEESNSSGDSGLECILSEVGSGSTFVQGALACDRNDSVVRIDAPLVSSCGCVPFAEPGDLIIDSARSAAQAQCVTSVGGDLRVLETAPDLVQLDQLTSIGGAAELHYELPPEVGGGFQPRNRSIDLSALTSIGGDVDMTTRRGSSQPKTLDTMTAAVTFIGGDVTISTYDNNVQAFAGINSIGGSVTLQGETGAAGNLDIFGGVTFPNLTDVGGDLTVQGFFACNSVFTTVVNVAGDVVARAVRLAPIQSFTSLEAVGGDLRFHEMKQFGAPWPSLVSVGGELHAWDNSILSSLSDLPVGSVDAHGIRLEDNLNLVILDGTAQAGSGDITISGSPSLSQCDVDTWLSSQSAGGWTGMSSVNGTVACR